jgi:SAM-dependent methyltransferase
MKDNFSHKSECYARFRPTYPKELFDFLLSLISGRMTAWDCGTGNGQVAVELAKHFETVFATDISESQVSHAPRKNNIVYKVERAEKTSFQDNQFDLITVAQAVHWFDFSLFHNEVKRTLKPNGILAIIGYPLPSIDARTDLIVKQFYENILGGYWDDERKYIDELYQTIPFPYTEITTPAFFSRYNWNRDQFIGYLGTWSAVQHYIRKNNTNPTDTIIDDVDQCWNDSTVKTVTFPILLRVGRNGK